MNDKILRWHTFTKGNHLAKKQTWLLAGSKEEAQAQEGGEYTGSRINVSDHPAGTKATRWLLGGGKVKTKTKLKK